MINRLPFTNFTEEQKLRQCLIEISHLFYRRGWSYATSSNYSAKLKNGRILITKSGKNKGRLNKNDLMTINNVGQALKPIRARPSAESLLHCQIYDSVPGTAVVLHTHSLYSTLLSKYIGTGILEISGYEMQKAFSNFSSHEEVMKIPMVENSQNMNEIINAVQDKLKKVEAYIIVGHGLYTWASSIHQALYQVEALEFILECEYRQMLLST